MHHFRLGNVAFRARRVRSARGARSCHIPPGEQMNTIPPQHLGGGRRVHVRVNARARLPPSVKSKLSRVASRTVPPARTLHVKSGEAVEAKFYSLRPTTLGAGIERGWVYGSAVTTAMTPGEASLRSLVQGKFVVSLSSSVICVHGQTLRNLEPHWATLGDGNAIGRL